MPTAARADFFRRTSQDAMVHWETPSVRLLVDPALEARFGPGVRDALSQAAAAWDLGGPVPQVELVQDLTEAQRALRSDELTNWVGFASEWTFGDKLAVTVSTYDAETGALVSAQVWINPERDFAMQGPDSAAADAERYDLQGVLTHEFGHVLGLGEADDAPEATMYPTFHRGETRQRTLSETDEQAVDDLYEQMGAVQISTQCAMTVPATGRRLGWPLLLLCLASVATQRRRLSALLQQTR